MSELMEKYLEEYRQEYLEEYFKQAYEEGFKLGYEETMLESIAAMMETLELSAQQAMDALRIPEADRARYLAML